MDVRNLEEIREIIRRRMPELKEKFKVKRIGVFGSFVHDKQNSSSDIDIIVEFKEPVGFEFLRLKVYLEEIFGRDVDLITPNALRPEIRDKILKEVVYT